MSTATVAPVDLSSVHLLYDFSSYEIRHRTRSEIAAVLSDYCTTLLQTEQNDFRRYMLLLRTRFLYKEVLSARPGGLYESLVGMSYVSPHMVSKLLCDDSQALHVYLARDAASDYVTAHLIDQLEIHPNDAALVYISRNTLDNAYRKTSQLSSLVETVEALHVKLQNLYENDDTFKLQIDRLITTLRECGALKRQQVRYIDSWAEGTIFTIISFAHKVAQDQELTVPTNQEISYAAMNTKTRLRVVKTSFDYQNVMQSLSDPYAVPLDFYESFLRKMQASSYVPLVSATYLPSKADISSWYQNESMSVPVIRSTQEYLELMTARIYKSYNHFGSLNLGHPFEWDRVSESLLDASPDKKIGNLLRYLLSVNAVLSYQNKSTFYLEEAGETSTAAKIPAKPDTMAIAALFGEEESHALEHIIHENIEHFVTSESRASMHLCSNLCSMMREFGQEVILSVSKDQNYDFQFFINDIKKYQPYNFSDRLIKLIDLMGVDTCVEMFTTSPISFIDSIRNITYEYELVNKPIKCIVFDIDGTITPVDSAIDMLVSVIRSGRRLGFITGKPLGACRQILTTILSKIPLDERSIYEKSIIFYAAHGSRTLFGDFRVEEVAFENEVLTDIEQFAIENRFEIISREKYRLLLQPKIGIENQNELRWIADKLSSQLNGKAGVYLAKWYENQQDQIVLPYNVIDVCATVRKDSLKAVLAWARQEDTSVTSNTILYIADESELADHDMLENGISVQGFGLLKTHKIVEGVLRGRN